MGMSAFYKGFETEAAQAESLRVLEKAAEFPSMMLDTSDMYGPHTNEQLLSKRMHCAAHRFRTFH